MRGDGTLSLVIDGELDAKLAMPIVEALGDCAIDVQIDLSRVTFMDSTGIRLLLLTRSEVRAANRSWEIAATSPVSYDLLRVAGLAQHLKAPPPVAADPTYL